MVLSAFGADTLRRQRQGQATDKATARVDQGTAGVLDALIRRDAQSDRDRQQDRQDSALELQRKNSEAANGVAERMAAINEAREKRQSHLFDADVNATVLQGLRDKVKAATNPDSLKVAKARLEDAEAQQVRDMFAADKLKAEADKAEKKLGNEPFKQGPASITDKLPEETFVPSEPDNQRGPLNEILKRGSGQAPASIDMASESGALADQSASFVPPPGERPAPPYLPGDDLFSGAPDERLDLVRRTAQGGQPASVDLAGVSGEAANRAAGEVPFFSRNVPDPTNRGAPPITGRGLPVSQISGTAPAPDEFLGDPKFFNLQPPAGPPLQRNLRETDSRSLDQANTITDPQEEIMGTPIVDPMEKGPEDFTTTQLAEARRFQSAPPEQTLAPDSVIESAAASEAQFDAALVSEMASTDSISETLAQLRQDPRSAARADRLGGDFVRGQIAMLEDSRGRERFAAQQAMLATRVAGRQEERKEIELQVKIADAALRAKSASNKDEAEFFKMWSNDDKWRAQLKLAQDKENNKGSGGGRTKAQKARDKLQQRTLRDNMVRYHRNNTTEQKMREVNGAPGTLDDNPVITKLNRNADGFRDNFMKDPEMKFWSVMTEAGLGWNSVSNLINNLVESGQARTPEEAKAKIMKANRKNNTFKADERKGGGPQEPGTELDLIYRDVERKSYTEDVDVEETVAKTRAFAATPKGSKVINTMMQQARAWADGEAEASGIAKGDPRYHILVANKVNEYLEKQRHKDNDRSVR